MKKRKILVTGGMVTSLLLAGTSQSLAQNIETKRPSLRPESSENVSDLSGRSSNYIEDTSYLDIKADDPLDFSYLDETSKNALIDEGFSPSQIHKIFNSKNSKRFRR